MSGLIDFFAPEQGPKGNCSNMFAGLFGRDASERTNILPLGDVRCSVSTAPRADQWFEVIGIAITVEFSR